MTSKRLQKSIILTAALLLAGCNDKAAHEIDPRCEDIDCGGYGRCVVTPEDEITCICRPGYRNAQNDDLICEFGPEELPYEPIPQYGTCDNINCGRHGVCIEHADGTVQCICDKGYQLLPESPQVCVARDPCDGVNCSGHGKCIENTNGLAECECFDGYTHPNSELTKCFPKDQDPCTEIDCGEHAACYVENGVFIECLCDDGYTHTNGDRTVCERVTKPCDDTTDNNHNYMRDCAETAPDQGETCPKRHNELCTNIPNTRSCTDFCDSFIGNKCSTKCTDDSQCISDDYFCRRDGRCAPKVFETVWQTDKDDLDIYFPGGNGECDYDIDWGDGSKETYTSCADTRMHHYAKAGTYHVKVTGVLNHWSCVTIDKIEKEVWSACAQVKNNAYLVKVESFGPVRLDEMRTYSQEYLIPFGAFSMAYQLESVSEIDIPDLSDFKDASAMFEYA